MTKKTNLSAQRSDGDLFFVDSSDDEWEVRDYLHEWTEISVSFDIPACQSTVAEIYPALWKHACSPEDRTPDQHDAYTVATWLRPADRDGRLQDALHPNRSPPERGVAQVGAGFWEWGRNPCSTG